MTITIAPQYTQRNYTWTNWKIIEDTKDFIYQYDDDGSIYTIWGYDGPEVHICNIWKGTVPYGIVNSGYSQEQNDLDKTDFETNFKPHANKTIDQINQQRNVIYEASLSNFFTPANNYSNYYLGISLLNPNNNYKHLQEDAKGIRIYALDCIAAKTNPNDVWIIELGIITDIAPTTANMTFINTGSIYLSNNGVSNSGLTVLQFPIYIDCMVIDGYLNRIAGGISFQNIPGIGTSIDIFDASGSAVRPQIGDVIVSMSCVSDITGFNPTIPVGLGIFQYHFWYTVEN